MEARKHVRRLADRLHTRSRPELTSMNMLGRSIASKMVALVVIAAGCATAADDRTLAPTNTESRAQGATTSVAEPERSFVLDSMADVPVKGPVVDEAAFSAERGCGYEVIDGAPANGPRVFSIAATEGTYRVTLWLGGAQASNNSVKAESRQMVLRDVSTRPGEIVEKSFLVNVRTPRISKTEKVKLQANELAMYRWDDKLTLEFNGNTPHVAAMRIAHVDDVKTVYLVGDSTVCDHQAEPWAGWGQMLPAMLDLDNVVVSNHAESGESYARFIREKRWDKIRSTLRAGDVVIMQMGHNDQKDESPAGLQVFKDCMNRLISESRARGATPVLVTPMNRRRFGDDGKVAASTSDYPDAVRLVAKEQKVSLIELREMSKTLYEAFGKDESAALFVDMTHHTNFGAYLLARCVAKSLQAGPTELASLVRDDLGDFDPAHPPLERNVTLPASPQRDMTRPEGN